MGEKERRCRLAQRAFASRYGGIKRKMAFISMLLAAGLIWLLFLIWIGAIVLGIVLLALFFVLLRSNKKVRKTWKKVLAIVCLALSIGSMSLAAWGCYAVTHAFGASMAVQTPDGTKVPVTREDGLEIEQMVGMDDLSGFKRKLEENPALWYYRTAEGDNLMGMAVSRNGIEITAYLLEQGADVNDLGSAQGDTALDRYCRNMQRGAYHTKMITLLDSGAVIPADLPLMQDILGAFSEDGDLTEEELALLKRLIDAGMGVTAANEQGENAAEYFARAAEEQQLLPEQVQEALEILKGQ